MTTKAGCPFCGLIESGSVYWEGRWAVAIVPLTDPRIAAAERVVTIARTLLDRAAQDFPALAHALADFDAAQDTPKGEDEYPEIDWPVSEEESDWTFLRSERRDGRIRFLWDTQRGPAWTPWAALQENNDE